MFYFPGNSPWTLAVNIKALKEETAKPPGPTVNKGRASPEILVFFKNVNLISSWKGFWD